jgi:hypothetical protein
MLAVLVMASVGAKEPGVRGLQIGEPSHLKRLCR